MVGQVGSSKCPMDRGDGDPRNWSAVRSVAYSPDGMSFVVGGYDGMVKIVAKAGVGIRGLGIWVWGSGFGIWDLGVGVWGLRLGV